MDRKIIDDFENGGAKLRKAIEGLTPREMLWAPARVEGVGLWSIQQVVFHLMDDELIWTTRMKSVIADEHPKVLGYNESKFAANLFYDALEVNAGLQLLELNRRLFSVVLRKLPDSAFGRRGEHSEIGMFTLEQAIGWTVEHLDHHVHYIALKREKLGKPIKE